LLLYIINKELSTGIAVVELKFPRSEFRKRSVMKKVRLFDTHTHYDDDAYGGSADELIGRILSDNVSGFMAVGCSLETIPKAIKMAEKYSNVYASVGIHPHYAGDLPKDYPALLEKWAGHSKVKAIGEFGLDYHYDGYNREKQIEVFRESLNLAVKLGLPAIIHSRDSSADTMEILREFFYGKPDKLRAVMHCYSGSVEMAEELVKMGIRISFTGVITFKNAKKAVSVCRKIPIEMFMLETDCPYMAPEPFRGKVCDSSMAWNTAAKIGEIKGLCAEEVVKICNKNAEKFFNISL
jgi:TatD DNase family protein